MNLATGHPPDTSLDVLLERAVTAPPALVWKAWTVPEHLIKWFAPAPYTTADCEIDLRPGGIFRTVMRAPNGDEHTTIGCYLEIVEHQRLAWTTVLGPGFRPSKPSPQPAFTTVVTLRETAGGTAYTALAMHADPATRQSHVERGFITGWNASHDQLVAMLT